MRKAPITVSSTDFEKLLKLAESARMDTRIPADNVAALETELSRATVVDPSQLPDDVVTMGATVAFREVDSHEVEKYTLVMPSEADVVNDRISVLAPIGTALLGYRAGDVVEWRVPSGRSQIEIIDVFQDRGAHPAPPVLIGSELGGIADAAAFAP